MTPPLTKWVVRRLELPRTGMVSVALTPEGIAYREYGRRRWLLLPHRTAFVAAATLGAESIRAERRSRRRMQHA